MICTNHEESSKQKTKCKYNNIYSMGNHNIFYFFIWNIYTKRFSFYYSNKPTTTSLPNSSNIKNKTKLQKT